MKYSIDISFEQIKLPPFEDILVLARNCPQGKIGLSKSFELLLPNGFELIEIDDDMIKAIFVKKAILHKVPREKVLKVLQAHVFPYIAEGEVVRVDFKVTMSVNNIGLQD